MSLIRGFVVGLFLLALSIIQIPAQVLFTDGFESYGIGALDKNLAGGPNAAPNGSGNPWFGPAPPNAQVVGTDSGVIPHSGSQMIRGAFVAGTDTDQNWYNLAYRQNSGNPFTGNVMLDWWFYDALGSGGANYRDYAAIGYYNTAPGNTDYPGTGNLNTGVAQIQRLSLGASAPTGYDNTKYQARVVGATDGLGTSEWFNLSVTRSVGWHEGKIVVGPVLGNGTADVSFYIDDMVNPVLIHNSVTAWGFNVVEFNTKFGTQTGYFDDVSFAVIPEPGTAALLLCGELTWLALRRRK